MDPQGKIRQQNGDSRIQKSLAQSGHGPVSVDAVTRFLIGNELTAPAPAIVLKSSTKEWRQKNEVWDSAVPILLSKIASELTLEPLIRR